VHELPPIDKLDTLPIEREERITDAEVSLENTSDLTGK
jgi:hypothetical protein